MIGSGPSGMTASIYTSRALLKTLVITGQMIGGQIALTYNVDNYPGFPQGVTGPVLTELFRKQAEGFGAHFIEDEATSVNFKTNPLKVYVGEKEYKTNSVILATGSINKKLGIESEDRLMGRGVFSCATCDAVLYEGKRVVVIGGGDSAVQEALDLAKFAKEVIVVYRRNILTACLCLKNRAENNQRIKLIWNTTVEEILGKDRVEGVRLRDLETGVERTLNCDGVLIAIGWNPNTSLFKGQIDLDEEGYIISKTGTDTSVEGVFVAGDIQDKKFRQVSTACGSGCKAALEAERYLDKLQNEAKYADT